MLASKPHIGVSENGDTMVYPHYMMWSFSLSCYTAAEAWDPAQHCASPNMAI